MYGDNMQANILWVGGVGEVFLNPVGDSCIAKQYDMTLF